MSPLSLRKRIRIGIAWALLCVGASGASPASARSQIEGLEPQSGVLSRADIEALIAEAARRFGVPGDWIRAVMRQESAFDPRATSSAGAMGLMQVMPATYAELRARHGLGPDPYAPRDNVLAGAAYLRELHDQFGPEGMLAAYNAGPGRYLQHRDQGRPLPLETRHYMARIGRLEGGPAFVRPPMEPRPPAPDLRAAPLFPVGWTAPSSAADSLFVSLSPLTPERAE